MPMAFLSPEQGGKPLEEEPVQVPHSHNPVCAVGRSSCAGVGVGVGWSGEQPGSYSNYNPAFHPSPSLAEAATCSLFVCFCL